VWLRRSPEVRLRIGIGYDVHRLCAGRRLVLGGVQMETHLGLEGHSDADVLTHAIIDALLGAAALPDIGRQFPDSDPAYAGASSLRLLKRTMELLNQAGYKPHNVDAVVAAEAPRLAPHIDAMRARLAEVLELQTGAVSVKATTGEKLGFVGSEEGMCAWAVCTIEEVR